MIVLNQEEIIKYTHKLLSMRTFTQYGTSLFRALDAHLPSFQIFSLDLDLNNIVVNSETLLLNMYALN